jgi:LPXTG-motif cell wall-anchored protein
LKIGDQFRLFSSVLNIETDGTIIAHVASANSVRPEEYNFTKPLAVQSDSESTAVIFEIASENPLVDAKVRETTELKHIEVAEETVEESTNWLLWLICALVAIGGLVVIIRRKS